MLQDQEQDQDLKSQYQNRRILVSGGWRPRPRSRLSRTTRLFIVMFIWRL